MHQVDLDHDEAKEMIAKDLDAVLEFNEGWDQKGLVLFDPQRTLPTQWTDPKDWPPVSKTGDVMDFDLVR